MRYIINENQRGLLYKNGKFVKMLQPGKHRFFGSAYTVEVMKLDPTQPFMPQQAGNGEFDLNIYLRDKALKESLELVEVPEQSLALHYRNNIFSSCLRPGRYAFWKLFGQHEFRILDAKTPLVGPEVPEYLFRQMLPAWYQRVEVAEYQKGRLYYDGVFVRLLEPGTYYFWKTGVKAEVTLVDTRLQQLNIQGQEMLTLDKVALRVNFVCRYRISDYNKVFTEIDDYQEQLRVLVQLALREYVGHTKLDELLEKREELDSFVLARLKEKEAECYVSVSDAGVKDLILPGEIRDIMNTVLLAEKRAQANVITRREEVASTRSLLNTAKLMDENQTLLRLKEMEYLEKVCENVGTITINGGRDLLGQLTSLLTSGGQQN